MSLYSFNRSLVINNARISWPEGSIDAGDTNSERGIKRSYESSDISVKKNKHNEKEQFPSNEIQVCKQMLEIMQPSESVAKCLRRLEGGKGGMVAGKRLKTKNKGEQVVADTRKMNKMLQLVTITGTLDIYDETYESIKFKVQQADVEEGLGVLEGQQGADGGHTEAKDKEELDRGSRVENNSLKPQSSEKPIHLDYQNSPEEILSLQSYSPSSGSDWSPPNIVQNANNEGDNKIDSLRPNAYLRHPGGGTGGT